MKDFALDANGDLLIENNEISMVTEAELIQQKVWTELRTNLREWFFDWERGIDFKNLNGKDRSADIARMEIERGLRKVDETFEITEFTYTADKETRKATITFKARTASGDEVGGDYTWA